MNSLLPPGASALERAAAEAFARAQALDVPLRDLWNPERCPLDLLPFLAWAFSVDRWDPAWSEAAKRAVVRAAFFVHRHKGTVAALRRVIEPLARLLEIVEWWQTEPQGLPGTFAVRVAVLERGIDATTIAELERLIDDAKPLTRRLIALSVEIEAAGTVFAGAALVSGDDTTIYPFAITDREVAGFPHLASALHGAEITTIYPDPHAP